MLKRSRPESVSTAVAAPSHAEHSVVPTRPWTATEAELLRDLVAQECKLSDVATGLGRTVAECRAKHAELTTASAARSVPATAAWTATSSSSSVVSQVGRRVTASTSASSASTTTGGTRGAPNTAPWTLEDDMCLVEAVATHGPTWKEVRERYLPTRSERTLRRRWSVIESVIINAQATARLDGRQPPSLAGGGQNLLRDALADFHAASAEKGRSGSSHQRVAAALLGGTFPSTPATTTSPTPLPTPGHRSPSLVSSTHGGALSSSSASALSYGGSTSFASTVTANGGGGVSPVARSPRLGAKRPLPSPSVPAAVGAGSAAAAGPLAASQPALAQPAASSPSRSLMPSSSASSEQHDMTGDDIVQTVQQFVERHAVDASAGQATAAAAVSSSQPAPTTSARRDRRAKATVEAHQKAAAVTSVESVMAHLELHRPAEQVDRVALEVSHRQMSAFDARATGGQPATAATAAGTSAPAIVPSTVLQMDCGVDVVPPPQPAAPHHPGIRELRGVMSNLRQPAREEVQAIVEMHIHDTIEATSVGAVTGSNPAFPSAAAAAAPREPLDDQAASASTSSTVARASTAAFFASWANVEMSGALHGNAAWANVFEPQRCVFRAPRLFSAFLPCAYLSLSSAAATSSTTTGDPRRESFVSSLTSSLPNLCPVLVIEQARSAAESVRAAMPKLSSLRRPTGPWQLLGAGRIRRDSESMLDVPVMTSRRLFDPAS